MNLTDQQILGLLEKKQKERVHTYQKNYKKEHRQTLAIQRRQLSNQKKATDLKPFIACDGEGAGEGIDHIFWLLRVGDKALWHEDGSELKSLEILTWLADLGASGIMTESIPVAFFFDYDTSMILRHLPEKNLKELMFDGSYCVRNSCKHHKNSHIRGWNSCFSQGCQCKTYLRGGETTIFLGGGLEKYLKVKLSHRQFKVGWNDSQYMTITDTGDLFQQSFLTTITKWQKVEGMPDLCTDEELERIRVNKERRASFAIGFDLETFDYNALECRILAELMERFRKMCYDNGIYPDMWTGPGRLAEDIFKSENVPKRTDLDLPEFIERLGDYAYYGGRMEGIHFGAHKDVIAYDIASAYPHAYTMLPCLIKGHGKWEEVDFTEVVAGNLSNTLIVGSFVVQDSKPPRICGLPMRDKKGSITFPTNTYGVWWYPEVRETINLYKKEGYEFIQRIDACFTWRSTCSDRPGNFTDKWFQIRVQVGKSTRGFPIKLALNSLYGKAAQRVGNPKWANVVWAGLLTSITRARLLEATNTLSTESIISYQTDGIFCRIGENSTSLGGIGTGLGEWEVEHYPELFLIQSGVYSAVDEKGERKNKTRGMRDFEFKAAYDEIVRAWEDKGWTGFFDLPKRNTFVTIKLGLMWGKPNLIGTWCKQDRKLSFFANTDKRDVWELGLIGDTFETKDGTTYAPGPLHRVMKKLEYGDHPFNPLWEGISQEEKCVYKSFTYPYSREIALRLNEDRRNEEISYSYVTPDEPYNLTEG